MASKHRRESVGSSAGNEPEPPGEVDYATLSPVSLVGIHDRPDGRCIVSERIGGTAACKAVVGPAE